MKNNIKFLSLLAVFALLAFVPLAMAQKGGKKKPPPPPPPAPSDPAIAYTAPGTSQDRWDLMVMDADGTNQRTVVTSKFTHNVDLDWSPDGKQLVFRMDDGPRFDNDAICIVNVDGSGLHQIKASARGIRPAWSPVEIGGRYWIAFTDRAVLSDGSLKQDSDIFLMDTEGNNLTNLTEAEEVDEWEADWSPDGKRLAVQTYDSVTHVADIVLYGVDCVDLHCAATKLGSIIYVPNSPLADNTDVGGANWARSSIHNRLVFSAQMGIGEDYDLWTVDLDTGVFQQLTDTPQRYEFDASWLPDDSGVFFSEGHEGGLWVMNYETGATRLIVTPQQAGITFFYKPKWRRNK